VGTQQAAGSLAGQDGRPAADNPDAMMAEVHKEFSSMEDRLKGNMRVQKNMIERFGMSFGKVLSKHGARNDVVEQVTQALFETLPLVRSHRIFPKYSPMFSISFLFPCLSPSHSPSYSPSTTPTLHVLNLDPRPPSGG
jgi:hypothetical protein